ncbi:MAG: 7-carboxy-7-deazaguanine synthase [Candidatus Anoxychlamydiales bacterium]|nr:7-carboxy-7-deazaguanine synthase [Candidatus Anoxychlamydiales bacterium]
MLIGGLQKFSLIDYPNKIAAIVFTQGCYFRCRYCHNPNLVLESNFQNRIDEKDFFSFLETRINKLDAVVITGGEPTIQKDLKEFIKKIKDLNFSVKLDTSGINPNILQDLIESNLLDYIAMDIKAPLEKYKEIIQRDIDTSKISQSINLIMSSNVDYEFRTTLVDKLHIKEDPIKIAKLIKGSKKYILQKFVSNEILDPNLKNYKSFSDDIFNYLQKELLKFIKKVSIR